MTISRTGLRAAAVALLATLALSVAVVAPASACACGGVGAPTGESVEATRPYLRDGWVIAAIKLTAGPDAPHALDSELQPIRATFSSASRRWPCG